MFLEIRMYLYGILSAFPVFHCTLSHPPFLSAHLSCPPSLTSFLSLSCLPNSPILPLHLSVSSCLLCMLFWAPSSPLSYFSPCIKIRFWAPSSRPLSLSLLPSLPHAQSFKWWSHFLSVPIAQLIRAQRGIWEALSSIPGAGNSFFSIIFFWVDKFLIVRYVRERDGGGGGGGGRGKKIY